MQRIMIMCLGGEASSILAMALYKCGMHVGNEKTYWHPNWLIPHVEHSAFTALAGSVGVQIAEDERSRIVASFPGIPGSTGLEKLENIMRAYDSEAARNNWECYGIKTTSGICNNKWNLVGQMVFSVWPDAVFMASLKRPSHPDSWNMVKQARFDILNHGGVLVPYPDAWKDGSICRYVEICGLHWNPDLVGLYKPDQHDSKWECEQIYSCTQEYYQMLEQSKQNLGRS